MIKTIIFDFGDVFINLDKQGAMHNALKLFQLKRFEPDLIKTNLQYEVGKISTNEFLNFYKRKFKYLSEDDIVEAWNYILKDFPKYRLDFIKNLSEENKYKLILLSNTNALHIDFIKQNVTFFEEFKNYFDKFYLSHDINLRKPNKTIFNFVLNENRLEPETCLFIDDTKENTDAAARMGFNVWNLDENKEDIIDLFKIKKHLF